MITKKWMKRVLAGVLCALALMVVTLPAKDVYASQPINAHEEGDTKVDGQGDVDADGYLNNGEEATVVSSTDNVGNGLSDKVSSNAKTGDILNGRNVIVLCVAVGALYVMVRNGKKENV